MPTAVCMRCDRHSFSNLCLNCRAPMPRTRSVTLCYRCELRHNGVPESAIDVACQRNPLVNYSDEESY